MASWSDLNNDALEHIMGFLSLSDLHRFSAVCRNWRWVAKHKHCPPAEQLPWLMMGEDASTRKCKFYSLTEKRYYYIDIPELQGQYWIGSSYGWLFIIDREFIPRLFNPFTREFVELPVLPSFEEKMVRESSRKAILSHDPTDTRDFSVLFLYGKYITNVSFWRRGDSTWTCVPCDDLISDAIFFKGKFYLAIWKDLLVIPDLGPNPTMKQVMPLSLEGIRYLVDYEGELLLVKRHLENIGDVPNMHLVTCMFEVQKLNLEKRKTSRYMDLAFCNYATFLGVSRPLVVDSWRFQECKIYSIYFTDITPKYFVDVHGYDDVGVYNLITDSIERCPPDYQPSAQPPIWLTPNINKL